MTPIIVSFLPGMPGQALADFLFTENGKEFFPEEFERKGRGQYSIYGLKQGAMSDEDFENYIQSKIKAIIPMCHGHLVTDYRNYSVLKSLAPEHHIIKLYPTDYLSYIKHVVKRKEVDENEFTLNVDNAFGEICLYYDIINAETDKDNIYDYSNLSNLDNLIELFKLINGAEPDEFSVEYAQEMLVKPHPAPLADCTSLNYEKIIETINPTDYFDIALCIFLYERNYKMINKNRQWSVDDIPNSVDGATKFLIDNSKRYKLF